MWASSMKQDNTPYFVMGQRAGDSLQFQDSGESYLRAMQMKGRREWPLLSCFFTALQAATAGIKLRGHRPLGTRCTSCKWLPADGSRRMRYISMKLYVWRNILIFYCVYIEGRTDKVLQEVGGSAPETSFQARFSGQHLPDDLQVDEKTRAQAIQSAAHQRRSIDAWTRCWNCRRIWLPMLHLDQSSSCYGWGPLFLVCG